MFGLMKFGIKQAKAAGKHLSTAEHRSVVKAVFVALGVRFTLPEELKVEKEKVQLREQSYTFKMVKFIKQQDKKQKALDDAGQVLNQDRRVLNGLSNEWL